MNDMKRSRFFFYLSIYIYLYLLVSTCICSTHYEMINHNTIDAPTQGWFRRDKCIHNQHAPVKTYTEERLGLTYHVHNAGLTYQVGGSKARLALGLLARIFFLEHFVPKPFYIRYFFFQKSLF